MKVSYLPRFKKQFKNCPEQIRKKFYKQIVYLLRDLRHPSLQAKKYNEAEGTWQARVDQNFRFYFSIEKDTYFLLEIGPHPE